MSMLLEQAQSKTFARACRMPRTAEAQTWRKLVTPRSLEIPLSNRALSRLTLARLPQGMMSSTSNAVTPWVINSSHLKSALQGETVRGPRPSRPEGKDTCTSERLTLNARDSLMPPPEDQNCQRSLEDLHLCMSLLCSSCSLFLRPLTSKAWHELTFIQPALTPGAHCIGRVLADCVS